MILTVRNARPQAGNGPAQGRAKGVEYGIVGDAVLVTPPIQPQPTAKGQEHKTK